MWSDVFPPPVFLSFTSHFGFPDFKGHLGIYFLSWRSGFCFSLLRELWPRVWFCLKVWNTIQSATKERRRETSWVRRFPSRRLDQGGGLRARTPSRWSGEKRRRATEQAHQKGHSDQHCGGQERPRDFHPKPALSPVTVLAQSPQSSFPCHIPPPSTATQSPWNPERMGSQQMPRA